MVGVRAGIFSSKNFLSGLAEALGVRDEQVELSRLKEMGGRRALPSLPEPVNTRSSSRRQAQSASLIVGTRVVGLVQRDLVGLAIAADALINTGSVGGYTIAKSPVVAGEAFGTKVVLSTGKELCQNGVPSLTCADKLSNVNASVYVPPPVENQSSALTEVLVSLGVVIFVLVCCCVPLASMVSQGGSRKGLMGFLIDCCVTHNALLVCWGGARRWREEVQRRGAAHRARRDQRRQDDAVQPKPKFGHGDAFQSGETAGVLVNKTYYNAIPFAKEMATFDGDVKRFVLGEPEGCIEAEDVEVGTVGTPLGGSVPWEEAWSTPRDACLSGEALHGGPVKAQPSPKGAVDVPRDEEERVARGAPGVGAHSVDEVIMRQRRLLEAQSKLSEWPRRSKRSCGRAEASEELSCLRPLIYKTMHAHPLK